MTCLAPVPGEDLECLNAHEITCLLFPPALSAMLQTVSQLTSHSPPRPRIGGRSWIRYAFVGAYIRHEPPRLPSQWDGSLIEREPNARVWKGRKLTSELSIHSPAWKRWEKSPGNASPPPSRLSGWPETNPPLHRDAGLGSAPLAEGDTRGHLWWFLLRHMLLLR